MKARHARTFLPLLAKFEEESRKVPGVLSFQHYHDRQDANIIFLEGRFKAKERKGMFSLRCDLESEDGDARLKRAF